MFWKHRDWIAWGLIFLAALTWCLGQSSLGAFQRAEGAIESTTVSYTEIWETTYPEGSSSLASTAGEEETTPPYSETIPSTNLAPRRSRAFWGMVLCFCAAALAVFGVFVLFQKRPILGPDGCFLVLGWAWQSIYFLSEFFSGGDYIFWDYQIHGLLFGITFFLVLLGLFLLRELWSWIKFGFSLDWCLSLRLSGRFEGQTGVLGIRILGLALSVGGFFLALAQNTNRLIPLLSYGFAGILSVLCIRRYALDAEHLKKQIACTYQGIPPESRPGVFSPSEAQLQQLQAKQQEAIHTALTSERFKVELIANVSHDLRTPLTAILGYSQLLEGEPLSPKGLQELEKLQLKAGYMKDLVESLFELTKVSSGVAECKASQIDLIRLLEQTIGLYDDALCQAGLEVRRKYAQPSMLLTTDGGRLHQVFANLLGNSVKYALRGTRIYLEATQSDSLIRVRMVNTAAYEMDFTPEEITRRFVRGDKARSTRGSGLGLAIAKTYTESLGGHFTVSIDGDQFSALVELPKALPPTQA